VEPFFAQNILLFVRRDHLDRYSMLQSERNEMVPSQLSVVHPKVYLAALVGNRGPLGLLWLLPRLFVEALKRRTRTVRQV
jgi:hypothetical protein